MALEVDVMLDITFYFGRRIPYFTTEALSLLSTQDHCDIPCATNPNESPHGNTSEVHPAKMRNAADQ